MERIIIASIYPSVCVLYTHWYNYYNETAPVYSECKIQDTLIYTDLLLCNLHVIYRNTGIHCFWIINNSQQVISTLKDINASAKAKHFDSYDFSTLYTSIPHDSLKNNMRVLIDEAFKVRGAVYLSVNKRGKSYWAQAPNACMNIDRLELVAMIV